jgi:hypothetical protein
MADQDQLDQVEAYNEAINEAIMQALDQALQQPTDKEAINEAIMQAVNQAVNQAVDQAVDQAVQRRRATLVSAGVAVIAACEAVIELVTPTIERTPYHTSMLSGEAWVQELLTGHPNRIRNEFGVYRQTFIILVQTLREIGIRSSRHVTIEEQVGIFLYTAVTGLSSTHVGERFQRSPSTITK